MDIHKQSLKMAERLKQLRESRKLSHQKLSEAIEQRYGVKISKDSLINYEVTDEHHTKAYKNEGMNMKYICCLANFFCVSTDYLLGTSDTRNIDTQKITALQLGLSEKAINNLQLINEVEPKITTLLNWIIETENPISSDNEENVCYTGGFLLDLVRYFLINDNLEYPTLVLTDDGRMKLFAEDEQCIEPNASLFYVGDLVSLSALDDIRATLKTMHQQFESEKPHIAHRRMLKATKDAEGLSALINPNDNELQEKMIQIYQNARKRGDFPWQPSSSAATATK